ncbi:MAG: hypothetical protein JEY99_19885 [Spirochaetales bacterium]|nr:hypothetical protein [Spirochaetales bacterium]
MAGNINTKLSDVGEKVLRVTDSMENILEIMDDITGLNSNLISIVESNHDLSTSLREQTLETSLAVSNVTRDIEKAVTEAEQLSAIGTIVTEELGSIG